MPRKFDAAVIGSGPGGYVAAVRAAQLGLKTVCVEKNQTLGGTCLNVGCIPSKALLQSSEHYEWLKKHSQEHGILAKDISLDFSKMSQRKNQIVKGLVDSIAALFKKNGIEPILGTAKFLDSRTILVEGEKGQQQIEADNVILATGSEPITLPFLPFDEKVVLSSTGALALPHVPKKMTVIGAGVIGVELASVFQRLGSQVVLIEMLDIICPAMDPAISRMLLQVLRKQGLEFHLESKVTKAKVDSNNATLTYIENGQENSITSDVVLVAVGRRPYTQGLDLAKAGITPDSKGFVKVDGLFRTSAKNVYAIGDLIDGPMLAHRASEEGIAVAEIIAGHAPHLNYMAIPNVIYTSPEVAAVGMTEPEAKASGWQLKIGNCAFRGNPRARCSGEIEGAVKIIGEASSGRLVGLHILGAHASEMIGEGVIAIEKRATLEEIAQAPHAHPTMTEAIKEAALNALGRAIHF
jgi:dihydrolipoamide dehydrogenase